MKNKSKVNLSNLKSTEDLELIPVEIETLVSTSDHRTFVVLTDGDAKKIIELNSYESTMLAFAMRGLYLNSHIQTIHQLFFKFLKSFKTEIESIYIESKVGDVIYSSIKFIDSKHTRTFSITSLCDGLILSIISEKQIYAVASVWDDMDEQDDWDYEEYLADFPDDLDDD